MAHILQHHARRILAHSSRTTTRFFSSHTNKTLWSSNQILHSRIESALDQKSNISTVLEQWRQQQGNQLNASLVRGIVEKLRDSERFHQALDVSDWMIERKICNLVPEDFTSRFHLIDNVLGLKEAEKFFESIPKNQRGESIYSALLHSYTKDGNVNLDKAESTFEKMRELGLLSKPCPYNSMISLYGSIGKRGKVDKILRDMEGNNVEIDSVTVNKVLRVYAFRDDVESIDNFRARFEATATLELSTTLDMAEAYLEKDLKEKAREMLCRAEKFKDPESYERLIKLYGQAGEVEDVFRIWDMYKKTRKMDRQGFRALIGSLLKLDEINRAEEMYYKEWECAGFKFDRWITSMLEDGYREKGMVNKADKLMYKNRRDIELELDTPITPLLEVWGKYWNQVKPSDSRGLIKNLLDLNQFSNALEVSSWMFQKKVFKLFPEDYATRLHLIEKVLGLEEAEKFFETCIPENMKDYSVYATLLTSYTRSSKTLDKAESIFEKMRELSFLSKLSPFNKMISLYSELGKRIEVENVLKEMKENNIEPDSVTMNNVLRVYAYVSAIEPMEKYKSECDDNVKNLKLELKTRDAMAEAYKREGLTLKAIEIIASKKEVHRLWNEYKKDNKGSNNEGYLSVVRSLLRLGDVKGAEEVYKEWEPQGPDFDYRIASLLMSRCCEVGDNEVKVEKVLESCREKKKRMQLKLFKEFYGAWAVCSAFALVPPGWTWFFEEEKFLGWTGSVLLLLFVISELCLN
ncbi:unnamed protein product [Arabis nemorensis]|uniref:Pentacotripeptide-repeat region of PRORP domain-containing protein n=1 Tax=Arabis nemorensis TaxID=586526 RepID=A0A565B6F3_9BRAS|nr:unnamed protein product [Arabis nemorensis]